MLEVQKLTVFYHNTKVLSNVSLKVKPGEVHAIMGPNGSGKTTLAKVIMGDDSYTIVEGQIIFEGLKLATLQTHQRVQQGLFLIFQDPLALGEITNSSILNNILRNKLNKVYSTKSIKKLYKKRVFITNFFRRRVNEKFSGGEKKQNELLHMLLLNPKLVVIDELDSGLDSKTLQVLMKILNSFLDKSKSLLFITHYSRIFNYIKPDFIHLMLEGEIVKTKVYNYL
jgi:Fe-S cluster assembly ATP-binding protein